MQNITSPRADDKSVEQEIVSKGKTAPRITPADIEASFKGYNVFTAWSAAGPDVPRLEEMKLLTICVMVLKNGFTVVGTSACASPENFDADIGARLAVADAKRQVWPLLGYALRNHLTGQYLPTSAPASTPAERGELLLGVKHP